jgi:hypothetical protein
MSKQLTDGCILIVNGRSTKKNRDAHTPNLTAKAPTGTEG